MEQDADDVGDRGNDEEEEDEEGRLGIQLMPVTCDDYSS